MPRINYFKKICQNYGMNIVSLLSKTHTMKGILTTVLMINLMVTSCSTGKKALQHNQETNQVQNKQNSMLATYLLKSADGEFQEMQLTLNEGGSYRFYVSVESDDYGWVINDISGTYTLDKDKQAVKFDKQLKEYGISSLKVGEKQLIQDDKVFVAVQVDNELTEKYWKLVSINGKKINRNHIVDREPYLLLKSIFNRVNGHDGCNSFGGQFVLDENTITFKHVFSTMMACPNLLSFEHYLSILNSGKLTYKQNDDSLTLSSGKDKLVFEAVYF
jgi:heat shock protein HslJ